MSSPNRYNPPTNIPPPNIQIDMGVVNVQVGNNVVVAFTVKVGTLSLQLILPDNSARALGQELIKYADECKTAIVRPGAPGAGSA